MKNILIASIIILILLGSSNHSLFAQKYKYKEIFQIIQTQSKDLSYSMIKEYQKQDTISANPYYQLGLISQYWSESLDILTENEDVEYYINDAVNSFNLCLKLINEKEVRKNNDYYLWDKRDTKNSKDIELQDVITDINARIEHLNKLSQIDKKIILSFNLCVNDYNICWNKYIDFCKQYKQMNDLYLMANSETISQLNEICQKYDDFVKNFNQYKEYLKESAQKKYNQQYTIKEIDNYQLDGLVLANFLQNKFEIWNYKKWASNIIHMINTNIKDLRTEINKHMEKYVSNCEKLKQSYDLNSISYPYNEELVNHISIYDQQSFLNAYFGYLEIKFKLNKAIRQLEISKDSILQYELKNKLLISYEIVKLKKEVDSLSTDILKKCDELSYKKYNDFINKEFKGIQQAIEFFRNEPNETQNIINQSYNIIKNTLDQFLFNDTSKNSISADKKMIPFFCILPDFNNLQANKFYTVKIIAHKSIFYLTGYYSNNQKKINAFLACADKQKNILWIQHLNTQKLENPTGILIEPIEEGCLVLANGKIADQISNFLIKIDKKGNQTTINQILSTSYPRLMNYDEINDQLILVCKGINPTNDFTNQEITQIWMGTSNANPNWVLNIELTGNPFDIIKTDNEFVLFCNFSQYINEKNEKIINVTGIPNKPDICSFKISSDGKLLFSNAYKTKNASLGIKAYKLNSKTINILGYQTDFTDIIPIEKSTKLNLIYLLISNDGKLLF